MLSKYIAKTRLRLGFFGIFAFLGILLMSPPASAAGADDFVTTWDPGANGTIYIPIVRVAGLGVNLDDYNFTVDWGDGTSDTYVGAAITPQHAYTGPETEYDVRISGNFPAMTFLQANNGLSYSVSQANSKKLLKIKQWGTTKWQSFNSMFLNCSNLEAAYTDSPDTSQVTNMANTFANATKFNGAVNFDTSRVTTISTMFAGAISFNQPVNFDTSNVTDMAYLFSDASNFNQPVNFDTSKVTDMSYMFNGASNFNQPVNFDTSNVTDMDHMFSRATSFNQPVNFNTGKVRRFTSMFQGASNFNQELSGFDFRATRGESDIYNIAYNTKLSTLNNDRLIIALATQLGTSTQRAILHNNLHFCLSTPERTTLVAAGWTFFDTRDCTDFEPNAIALSNPFELSLDTPVSTSLGALAADSPINVPEQRFVYSLDCDTPAGNENFFEVVNGELRLKESLTGLTADDELKVCVRVTNAAGLTYDQNFTFTFHADAPTPVPEPSPAEPSTEAPNTSDRLPLYLALFSSASIVLYAVSRRLRRH